MNQSSTFLNKSKANETNLIKKIGTIFDESSEKIKVIENDDYDSFCDMKISDKIEFCTVKIDGNLSCRICLEENTAIGEKLVAPCYCRGSLAWVHSSCILIWLLYSRPEVLETKEAKCELCGKLVALVVETEMVYDSSQCCFSINEFVAEFIGVSGFLSIFYFLFHCINFCFQLFGELVCFVINLIFLILLIFIFFCYVWNFFRNFEKNSYVELSKTISLKNLNDQNEDVSKIGKII